MDWFTRELAGIGAVSYGWSSQLRVEQSATGGAVSFGWRSQLRVAQSATGGAVCYGWSSLLRVEQSATGGAVSYSWSSQLQLAQSVTVGATTTTGMAKSQMLHSRHIDSYLVYGSEGVVQAWRRDRDILTNLLLVGLVGGIGTLIIRLPRANYHLPPFYPFRHSNSHLPDTLIRAVQLTQQNKSTYRKPPSFCRQIQHISERIWTVKNQFVSKFEFRFQIRLFELVPLTS